MLDTLDRRIIHALQLDGRAPFSRIGAVLGVSDQTVARRYRRLRSTGRARVVGSPNPRAFGQDSWLLRLDCTPDAATGIADALARQPNTSWVTLNSGGTEVTCVIRTHGPQETEALLLRRLPRTPRVVAVRAHKTLHVFYGGPDSWLGKLNALTDAEAARLTRPEENTTPRRPGRVRPSDGDEALLAALAVDGRAGFADLAASTGHSESRVRRRLDELVRAGAVYFDVDVANDALGANEHVHVWLSVAPSHLAAVGEALAGHPEVPFAAAMTGPSNVCASIVCADAEDLYAYLTNRLGRLEGIGSVETTPMIRVVKREGTLLPRPAR